MVARVEVEGTHPVLSIETLKTKCCRVEIVEKDQGLEAACWRIKSKIEKQPSEAAVKA